MLIQLKEKLRNASKKEKMLILAALPKWTVTKVLEHFNTTPMRKLDLFPQGVTKYHHLFEQMLCDSPKENCCRLNCEKCPSYTEMRDTMSALLDEGNYEKFERRISFLF